MPEAYPDSRSPARHITIFRYGIHGDRSRASQRAERRLGRVKHTEALLTERDGSGKSRVASAGSAQLRRYAGRARIILVLLLGRWPSVKSPEQGGKLSAFGEG